MYPVISPSEKNANSFPLSLNSTLATSFPFSSPFEGYEIFVLLIPLLSRKYIRAGGGGGGGILERQCTRDIRIYQRYRRYLVHRYIEYSYIPRQSEDASGKTFLRGACGICVQILAIYPIGSRPAVILLCEIF